MAHIEERHQSNGKTIYRVKIRLRGSLPLSESFERRTDAKLWAQSMEAKIRGGLHFGMVESKRRTLAELLERYESEKLVTKGLGTQYTQKQQLTWWKDQIGHHRLSEVTPSLISQCKGKLLQGEKKPRSNATINRYFSLLSDAFTIAVREWQWLQHSPMDNIERLPEPKGRTRYLKSEELPRLLEAIKKSENKLLFPLISLALVTGSRKQELVTLRRKNIDLTFNTIRIERTKNGFSKECYIPEGGARNILKKLCEGKNPNDFLFPNKSGDRPMYFRTAWENARNKAGMPDFRFHDIKHTCASFLVMSGAATRAVGEVLGHTTLAMPLRYQHVSSDYRREVVQRMSDKYLREVS